MISSTVAGALAITVPGQYKTPIAIGALDKALIADLQIDFGMAKGATAVARDTGFTDGEGFWRFDAHWIFRKSQNSQWIIAGQSAPATRK
jgi:hypothetical protein